MAVLKWVLAAGAAVVGAIVLPLFWAAVSGLVGGVLDSIGVFIAAETFLAATPFLALVGFLGGGYWVIKR